jgi:hypothetical protein
MYDVVVIGLVLAFAGWVITGRVQLGIEIWRYRRRSWVGLCETGGWTGALNAETRTLVMTPPPREYGFFQQARAELSSRALFAHGALVLVAVDSAVTGDYLGTAIFGGGEIYLWFTAYSLASMLRNAELVVGDVVEPKRRWGTNSVVRVRTGDAESSAMISWRLLKLMRERHDHLQILMLPRGRAAGTGVALRPGKPGDVEIPELAAGDPPSR